jgi:4'-phosphopantetheinyl transferase
VLSWPQRSRAGVEGLLAEAGARVLGVDAGELAVSRDESGQPVVRAAGGRVWVSLSYGPDVVAVAASSCGPIGVDIEGPARPGMTRLADRWFDAAEARWLRSQPVADQQAAFLLLWTAKEALGKALGAGLRGAGLRRRVPLPPVTDGSFQSLPDGLQLAYPPLRADLVLAVATGPGGGPVSAITVQEDVDHAARSRNSARSRTSLPVVVRGN